MDIVIHKSYELIDVGLWTDSHHIRNKADALVMFVFLPFHSADLRISRWNYT